MSNAVVADVAPSELETTADAKQSDSDRLSNQHESEYDTASDSPSDDDDDEEHSDELRSSEEDLDQEEDGDLHSDDDDDGEEGEDGEGEDKKKVDDDEDRSNPQYIPKKGTFYEHDDRTADNPFAPSKGTLASDELQPVDAVKAAESAENVSTTAVSPLPAKVPPKKAAGGDKWSHDRFDMSEQAPKSRSELVSAYGYDIRSEDGPPKVKRNKHYGRGPTKYDRNWEDENAYGKQVVAKRAPRGPPKGEDFPKLNERRPKRNSHSRDDQSVQEGDAGSEDRGYNPRERRHPSGGAPRGERGEGRSFRGSNNDKGRDFKNSRNSSGRGGRDSGGRPMRRREDEGRGGGRSGGGGGGDQDQPSFNGMSFTNSNHGKRAENQEHSRNNAQGGQSEEMSQRVMPSANNARPVNYGSGRLQRRDDQAKPVAQHMQDQQHQQPSGQDMVGQLPLHAPSNQPQLAKRYSEKRQGMRNDQQSQQPSNVGVMEPQQQQLVQHAVPQQLQQQPPSHLGPQGTGPPPPFMNAQRGYPAMDPQQMMAQPQGPPPPQQMPVVAQPVAPVVPQAAAPIPAQYANYYPTEYLPQSTPQQPPPTAPTAYPSQAPVAAANGPPPQAPMINYVPAMQPQTQNPAQYSQYPGYQNYPQMPIPAGPPGNNVAYFAPPAAAPPQVQPPPRAALPKRRPTNAIPIVSPPDRNVPAGGKGRGRLVNDGPAPGGGGAGGDEKSGGGGDDIDHILDNMFVPRPQQTMTTSSGSRSKGDEANKEGSLEEGIKDIRLNDGAAGDAKPSD